MLKVILRHKATYRFLMVALGSLGVSNSEYITSQLEAIITIVLNACT